MPKSSLGTQLLAAARQIIFDRIRDNADNVPIDLKRGWLPGCGRDEFGRSLGLSDTGTQPDCRNRPDPRHTDQSTEATAFQTAVVARQGGSLPSSSDRIADSTCDHGDALGLAISK
jgi:hypothetical protein